MGKLLALVLAVGFAVYACNTNEARKSAGRAADPLDGLRGACKQFIERQQLETREAIWGNYWDWTVEASTGGEYAIGARYAVAGATRYTVCTVRRDADSIKLVRLTRMQ